MVKKKDLSHIPLYTNILVCSKGFMFDFGVFHRLTLKWFGKKCDAKKI